MGDTTVLIQTATLDKIKSVKLILSAKKGKQLNYDDTLLLLADKFLAENRI